MTNCHCSEYATCAFCLTYASLPRGNKRPPNEAGPPPRPSAKEPEAIRPSHYDLGVGQDLRVMDLVKAHTTGVFGFEGFLLGNVLKYVLRYQKKGQPLQDLKKARRYLDLLIVETENASEPPGETLE